MTFNLDHYRTSTEYREILRILQKASALQENFLWQSLEGSKNIVPIHHFEIDFVSRELVVYFDQNQYSLDVELPLYVKLDYRTSVFKIKNYRMGPSSIHFAFPIEIKTQELRNHLRFKVSGFEEKLVSLKPASSGYKNESISVLNARVLDVSYYGLGLSVSEQNRSFLKNNRILWINKLQDLVLKLPLLAEVVYINTEIAPSYRQRRQKEMKVGLKLSGVLPEEIYNRLLK